MQMTRVKMVKELLIMGVILLALYHAGMAIYSSVQRQIFLHNESTMLKSGQTQGQEVNKELRDGLSSYRSSTGIERLARERLNLAGPDEIVVRVSK